MQDRVVLNGEGKIRYSEAWITDVLTNVEEDSDSELTDYFMREGPMTQEEAEFYVMQRSNFLGRLMPEKDLELWSL
jgi:hypothetical protein